MSPLLVALIGVAVERLMVRRIYNRDPVYSLLLTFGLAFVMQDAARFIWGPNGLPPVSYTHLDVYKRQGNR